MERTPLDISAICVTGLLTASQITLHQGKGHFGIFQAMTLTAGGFYFPAILVKDNDLMQSELLFLNGNLSSSAGPLSSITDAENFSSLTLGKPEKICYA